MSIWSDIFKHYPPLAVWSCVDRTVRSDRKFCPTPGEFLALLRNATTPVEPRPTPNRERENEQASVGQLLRTTDETADVVATCDEGGEEFSATRGYIRTLQQLGSPVLCAVHAGEHLSRVGVRAQEDQAWASPILVSITRDGRRPTQDQVDRLHRIGFGPDLNSRLAKVGGMTREPDRRR